MNDNILRGFCQKCEMLGYISGGSIQFCGVSPLLAERKGWKLCNLADHKFEWFLSPKQMKIVWNSIEFRHWYIDEDNHEIFEEGEGLAEYVEKYPFLVAKILADAGKAST